MRIWGFGANGWRRLLIGSVLALAHASAVAGQATLEALPVAETSERVKEMAFPKYPAAAAARGVDGSVDVIVEIAEDGHVTSALAVAGPDELRASAEAAARAWRFDPVERDRRRVASRGMVRFTFSLGAEAGFVAARGPRETWRGSRTDGLAIARRPDPGERTEPRGVGKPEVVVVEVQTDRDGRVVTAHPKSGPEALHEAASVTALMWDFHGRRNPAVGEIRFRFVKDAKPTAEPGTPNR